MLDFTYQKQVAKEAYKRELKAISIRKKLFNKVKREAKLCHVSFSIVIYEYEWDMLGKDPYQVINDFAEAFGYLAGKPEAEPSKDLYMNYVVKFVK